MACEEEDTLHIDTNIVVESIVLGEGVVSPDKAIAPFHLVELWVVHNQPTNIKYSESPLSSSNINNDQTWSSQGMMTRLLGRSSIRNWSMFTCRPPAWFYQAMHVSYPCTNNSTSGIWRRHSTYWHKAQCKGAVQHVFDGFHQWKKKLWHKRDKCDNKVWDLN